MITVGRVRGINEVFANLENFSRVTGRSLFDELKTTGRTLSVALAHSTQPFGLGAVSREHGARSVARGVGKAVVSGAAVFEQLERRGGADGGKWQAAAFWEAWQDNDAAKAEQLVRDNLPDVQVQRRLQRHDHWRLRQENRRVFVPRRNAVEQYIKRHQKAVGRAKAGWAKAADDCGGHRGIPSWAATGRHKNAAGGAILNPNSRQPRVTVYNDTGWIRRILPPGEVQRATGIAVDKLRKRIQIILRKTARNAATRRAA